MPENNSIPYKLYTCTSVHVVPYQYTTGLYIYLILGCIELDDDTQSNHSMWEYLFSVGTIGWIGGTAGLTGILLLLILFIMFICSLPIVRRKGKFEVFYWTHNLFVFWYIILILHSPHFWKWFIGPAVIYITERILRSKIVKFIHYGRTYIEEVNLLPSKVSTNV